MAAKATILWSVSNRQRVEHTVPRFCNRCCKKGAAATHCTHRPWSTRSLQQTHLWLCHSALCMLLLFATGYMSFVLTAFPRLNPGQQNMLKTLERPQPG